MLALEMTRSGFHAHVRASGSLDHDDDIDTLTAAIAFVPDDEHLVIDLTGIRTISDRCAIALSRSLVDRGATAETVVVSSEPHVTMSLVLHDLDRICPVVTNHEDAVDVVRVRSGMTFATSEA